MCWIWTRRSLSSFSSSASSSDGQVSAAAQKAQALWNEQVGFGNIIKQQITAKRQEIQRGLSSEDGYVVIKPFLGSTLCKNMRSEAVYLYRSGLFYKSFSIQGEDQVIEKHNVYALELDGHEWEVAPSLLTYTRDVMMNVPQALNELFPKAKISQRAYATKLAVSTGGGSKYPLHTDNTGLPDTRKVTLVYYLNPGWKPSNGGQVRIFTKKGQEVDIEPEADTLLMFWSDQLEHEVLASYDEEEDAHRYTMTLWLTTEDPGTIQPPAPSVTEKEGKEQ